MFIIAFVEVKSDRNFMKPVPAAWCKKELGVSAGNT
jgi:hypothetical protein